MLVRSLDELTAADTADAGGKGANLGELRRAAFPVPDGFVITTASYALAAEAAGVTGETPATARVRLAASPVPAGIADAVREAYRALGASEVAVRSSATAEDLPDASFAGQQDTMLGVSGEDAVLDAVRRCWASLWNDRAVAYRQSHDVPAEGLRLAVVVQSRDITTLYPLPPNAPDDENDLRVYFSANVAQGVFDPFTPMGLQTFRLLSSAFATAFGRPVKHPAAGASIYAESGMRVFI